MNLTFSETLKTGFVARGPYESSVVYNNIQHDKGKQTAFYVKDGSHNMFLYIYAGLIKTKSELIYRIMMMMK